MGTKTVTTKFDDMNNAVTEDITSIRFAYKDKAYIIDLGTENAGKLDAALKPFIKAAAAEEQKTSPRSTAEQKQNAGWTSKDVRAWWKDNTDKLTGDAATFKENGRIFDAVYDAFNAEHPAK